MQKIQYLRDELTTLRRGEKRSYQKQRLAHYRPYEEEVLRHEMRLRKEGDRRESMRAQHEKLRSVHLRFVERIKRDIERTFTSGVDAQLNKVFWQILPPGQWTFDSVLNHYNELQHANPHIHFDVKRLQTVLQLNPLSLYVGIGEFDGYIVLAFPQTTKVVLECLIYGNAIYVIREDWLRLAKLPKFELLSQFPSQAR